VREPWGSDTLAKNKESDVLLFHAVPYTRFAGLFDPATIVEVNIEMAPGLKWSPLSSFLKPKLA